jgi:hypothetical protein
VRLETCVPMSNVLKRTIYSRRPQQNSNMCNVSKVEQRCSNRSPIAGASFLTKPADL